ncbi:MULTISPECIES: hypothetical protein [Sphingobacterium]|nr:MULTISPECIES: hypothetical protein [Sphingobacterium]QIH32278.1 hypothetical protein G6053_04915 [Sphingobacterium sp. DR205]
MNTLDLKGFGVQEMNAKEMMEIDGGQQTRVGKWLKAAGELAVWVAETFL